MKEVFSACRERALLAFAGALASTGQNAAVQPEPAQPNRGSQAASPHLHFATFVLMSIRASLLEVIGV